MASLGHNVFKALKPIYWHMADDCTLKKSPFPVFVMMTFVRPHRILGIILGTHERNGWEFGILMYPGHLQNCSDFGHSLLILLILAQFWLKFVAFSEEHMEGIATIMAWWCLRPEIQIIFSNQKGRSQYQGGMGAYKMFAQFLLVLILISVFFFMFWWVEYGGIQYFLYSGIGGALFIVHFNWCFWLTVKYIVISINFK